MGGVYHAGSTPYTTPLETSRMPRFRAVLFDFDGTLADSYAAITASVNHVLEQHGRPTLTEEKVRSLVGHGLQRLMDVARASRPSSS